MSTQARRIVADDADGHVDEGHQDEREVQGRRECIVAQYVENSATHSPPACRVATRCSTLGFLRLNADINADFNADINGDAISRPDSGLRLRSVKPHSDTRRPTALARAVNSSNYGMVQ